MSFNRLATSSSPYLLQHKDNPVHWWTWGPEALAEAERTHRPILLSVGYAACHWCHVMAHESFEDAETAAVMNELYVCIKVDREERPDIDSIYMNALHTLGEQGGWPLTMFLDSRARPFWGGTYFPKEERYGRPSFKRLLREVARIYRDEPEKVASNAAKITEILTPDPVPAGGPAFNEATVAEAVDKLLGIVDLERGGFKGAPKFPQYSMLWLLWRAGIRLDNSTARQAVITSLDNICQGGIYDHLGGGFARYSVDDRWLVPHFEKMLYDNALLVELMTEVWRETGSELYRTRIAETVAWLEREMIAEGGGFAASLDADSEGEEGRFYVWSMAEIVEVLGAEDAALFRTNYDVSPGGNWEGHTILNRLHRLALGPAEEEARLAGLRARLLERRSTRVRPGWDDKVLADWNGLMIAALARASLVFGRPQWLALAQRAFDFVATRMVQDGRLRHCFRQGLSEAPGTASDLANMSWAALRLYEATDETRYLDLARSWTDVANRHHWLPDGGYALAADDTTDVIVRMRMANDDATPNCNAVMASNLVALFLLTGDERHMQRSYQAFAAFRHHVARQIAAHTGMLAARVDQLAPQHVVLVGPERGKPLQEALWRASLPGAVHQCVERIEAVPTSPLAGKVAVDGRATGYVCVGPQCSLPATDAAALTESLRRARVRSTA